MKVELDFQLLDEEVNKGNISVRRHPKFPLSVYSYTPQCVFTKNWNEITRICRGLVLSNEGGIIAFPFEKFFNYEECAELGINIPEEDPEYIAMKLDGSMIVISQYYDELIINTKGSFQSEQVKMAWEIIRENNLEKALLEETKVCTLVFELIHPLDRKVVNYNGEKKLVLLFSRINEGYIAEFEEDSYEELLDTGKRINCPVIELYQNFSVTDLLKMAHMSPFINEEGFVLKYKNGFRVKIKFQEYFRLHKLISNLTDKFILENLRDGNNINEIFKDTPNEFYKEMLQKTFHWEDEYRKLNNEAIERYNNIICSLPYGYTRKNFALLVNEANYNYKFLLFAIEDGKNVDKMIWDILIKELKSD